MREQFTLRLILEAPFGEQSYSVAMPIDAIEAHDRYVGLRPLDGFEAFVTPNAFEVTVERLKKREYRKDDFEQAARKLARKLGERMEDEEGWHGVSRQAEYERQRAGGKW